MQKESVLHNQIAQYIKAQYKDALFISDMSGVKLTIGQSVKLAKLRSNKGYPDIFLIEPLKGYAGLFIELKAETPFKKDGTLKKSEHLEQQSNMLEKLQERGFMAVFGVGFDATKKIIDDYMEKPKGEISKHEIDTIIKRCSYLFEVSIKSIYGKSRIKPVVFARQLSMYIIKRKYRKDGQPLTDQFVGNIFGKGRLAVFHSCGKVEDYLQYDKYFIEKTKGIIKRYLNK